ncbi:Z-ring formation inhibitor MciZ [Bacillus testis]|uniref:Z-ring formation inhibitor MciZ n=1 Tax=Bacillus testis TaxID=1622072 RepID=UPI0028FCA7B4|nr:Z-ring formation inhibitor MciZ [Bacillus testis]
MKITVGITSIHMSGKAWEIQQKLKEYSLRYQYVSDWIAACQGAASETDKGQ